jgi:hypothetical protein
MNELENWLVRFLKIKNHQGIKCRIIPYKSGKIVKYMFQVNEDLRNIENYLTPDELTHYKSLIKKGVSISACWFFYGFIDIATLVAGF